jgi:hypothetical protein
MTDTLIICLTVLLVIAGLIWTSFHNEAKLWEREQERAKRTNAEAIRIGELSERLEYALGRFEETTSEMAKHFQETPKAVSALSERQVVLEGAIKAALAELVRVTGYSEAKYQQLMAKTVTAPRKPGQ